MIHLDTARAAALWFRRLHQERARALPPIERLAEYKAAAMFTAYVHRVPT